MTKPFPHVLYLMRLQQLHPRLQRPVLTQPDKNLYLKRQPFELHTLYKIFST